MCEACGLDQFRSFPKRGVSQHPLDERVFGRPVECHVRTIVGKLQSIVLFNKPGRFMERLNKSMKVVEWAIDGRELNAEMRVA